MGGYNVRSVNWGVIGGLNGGILEAVKHGVSGGVEDFCRLWRNAREVSGGG